MTRTRKAMRVLLAAGLTASWVGTATAATLEEQCISKRAAAAGQYLSCVHKWISKCSNGSGNCYPANLSKCRVTYTAVWPRLQMLTGTVCDQLRFEDNRNGTVTDHLTELVWEKKTADAGAQDWNNVLTWTAPDGDSTDEDGSVFTTFLSNLNSSGFAGANVWRLPTLAELMTLVNQPYPCTTSPCIDSALGPYTRTDSFYWSATTMPGNRSGAWGVEFNHGAVVNAHKSSADYVRAVRGGL